MKILCVLPQYHYGERCLGESHEYCAFVPALQRLGHTVLHFETFHSGPHYNFADLNTRLLECVIAEKPDIMLTVPGDYEIWTDTLRLIRENSRTVTVAWMSDDTWKYRRVSRFIAPYYDVVTTTYPHAVKAYQRDCVTKVHVTQWAANSQWLQSPLRAQQCCFPVSFVGLAYGYRPAWIRKCEKAGIAVHCFGNGWPNGPVKTEQIPWIYRQSIITLNFSDGWVHSRKHPRQIKARVFEVPGAGGFLITETAPGLDAFYEPGREIVTASGPDEMVSSIEHFLCNPAERDRIAEDAHARTLRDHTYDHRLDELVTFAASITKPNHWALAAPSLDTALQRHRNTRFLEALRSLLVTSMGWIWGPIRGTRAARRLVFNLSWRLAGSLTFSSAGLPGRMFPHH